MTSFFKAMSAVIWKDLTAEWRSREMLSSMLVFALLAIILFVFSFELSADLHRQAFAGTLWISLCFAGTLGLTRSFAQEQENSVVEGLLLAVAPRKVPRAHIAREQHAVHVSAHLAHPFECLAPVEAVERGFHAAVAHAVIDGLALADEAEGHIRPA